MLKSLKIDFFKGLQDSAMIVIGSCIERLAEENYMYNVSSL